MHVNAKQSIDMQLVFLTFIKFFYLIFYALTRPRRGRGNNHEARQDRAKAVKHRGEAEAASFLPRGEASASRQTSLIKVKIAQLKLVSYKIESY